MDAAEHFQELRAPDARGPSLVRQALAGFPQRHRLVHFKNILRAPGLRYAVVGKYPWSARAAEEPVAPATGVHRRQPHG